MSIHDQPIDYSNFYQAYTGIKFSIHSDVDCRVFVPKYRNLSNMPDNSSGTEMAFQDEWSSQSFLVDGSTDTIDKVLLQHLWGYANENIIWDDFKKSLSFTDIDIEEITLEEFVKDIDTFLIFHKLTKFGDVWWSNRVSTDGFGSASRNTNVNLPTINESEDANIIEIWSPDKYVNDEYKRYLSNPSTYNGFLNSSDFLTGGWFTVPDLIISTKPFEKLKIANILLNIKFTFDPVENFGHYCSVRNIIGSRIKDSTSSTVLDESLSQFNNNIFWADNLISQWVGGLISSDNISNFGVAGTFIDDACQQKKDQLNYKDISKNPNEISHSIQGQITLKPDYDVSERSFLGTIDPINWRSSDVDDNNHEIGILNVDRAFGGASGTRDNGVVTGGISTDDDASTNILANAELWSGNGFFKNILPRMNSARCFHVQGGSGRADCAVVGGYSSFNVDTPKDFSEWSKSDPLNNVEVLINATDPSLSYFQTVSGLQLNVARGDHAGNLTVETFSRQDKFEVEQLVKNFDLVGNDEQVLLEFVNDNSGDTNNFIRYSLSNINGFVFGGSTTGKSHLISTADDGEVIDLFEKINTTYLSASENILSQQPQTIASITEDSPQEIVADVININGRNNQGETITFEKCGKYRIEYINGGFSFGAGSDPSQDIVSEVIESSVTVPLGDTDGVIVNAPYCGNYRATLLNSTLINNNIKDQKVITDSLSIPGWDDFGPVLELPYAGTYRIEALEYQIEDPENIPACITNITELVADPVNPEDATFTVDRCGKYRVTYSSGRPQDTYLFVGDFYIDSGLNVRVFVDGTEVTPIFYDKNGAIASWDNCYSDEVGVTNSFIEFFPGSGDKPYFEFCVDAHPSAPAFIEIKWENPCSRDLTGTVNFTTSWLGQQDCICTDERQDIQVIVNDNLDGIAFQTTDEYLICVSEPNSKLRMRYPVNHETNNQEYGSVVTKVVYEGPNCVTPSGVDVFVNGLYETTIGGNLQLLGTEVNFCIPSNDSEIKLVGDPLWGGFANFEIGYIGQNSGCNCTDIALDDNNNWNSYIDIDINSQVHNTIFNVESSSLENLQIDLESLPSEKRYDFCVENANSKIRLTSSVSSDATIGSLNARILYLGQSDCACIDPLGEIEDTDTIAIRSDEVTIRYITTESNLRYPVRCHGMVYVGDNDSGISTGGRTEYNSLDGEDGVIQRLFNKYSSGYQTIVLQDIDRDELEKDRILDLVYELNRQTWIRRQNMMESVYWHCGVGDESRSIYWGGIHDSLGSLSVSVGGVTGNEVDPDSFICGDNVKTFTKNNIIKAGVDYVKVLEDSNCWETPIWETFDVELLFSDPRFRVDIETLQYSLGENYPEVLVTSVTPNPTLVIPQDAVISVDNSLGTTILEISTQTISGGSFTGLAEIIDSSNTTTGTFFIDEVELSLSTDITPIYPSGVVSISGQSVDFQITNIQVLRNFNVQITYTFSDEFYYDTSTNSNIYYEFFGVGNMTFNSMQDIYNSIVLDEFITSTNNNFRLLRSTEVTNLPFNIIGSETKMKFRLVSEDGIMVGVTTKDQEWKSSTSECGPDISEFIQLVADFTPIGENRWGVPIWTEGLYENVGQLVIDSDITRRDFIADDPEYGMTEYDELNANINTTSFGPLLNGRVLLTVDELSQKHEYTAMNDAEIDSTGVSACLSASSFINVDFPEEYNKEVSYTEWGTAFVQEYHSDNRYRSPVKWIPSNGIGLKPSNSEILYEPIAWKRYMDGVGLGGDVPNYDTIFNKTLNKIQDVSNWSDIKDWHIGQMCFGSPDSAVIVGGHKLSDEIYKTGIGNGYHSNPTTKRTFIWDLTSIPEEDTYLKNYMGRRMHTQFPENFEFFASISENVESSLQVTIFEGESDIIIERHGTVKFDGNGNSQEVTFDDPLPDDITTYAISLTPSENIELWWSNKTNTGFTIFVEIDNFIGAVDYIISKSVSITEKDISENEPLDGYIFDK